MSSIQDLEPRVIWKNFYAFTRIPRPSGHLEKVQQFLLDWAAERHIEAFKDDAGNIIMRKPATPGLEHLTTITMESHMDMVPQKAVDSTHDFINDPIETYIDGDWVKAKGTTLGSDDGIGAATAMAVLEASDLKHGPIEALYTVDEETTMYGVNHLSPDTLKGEILLNLDNETEGDIIVGSAGGEGIEPSMEYQEVESQPDFISVEIAIKGLKGGHSGLEIDLGRANANKLIARFVLDAIKKTNAELALWEGGDMWNAIPNHARAVLNIAKDQQETLATLAADWLLVFRKEQEGVEDDLSLTISTTEKVEKIVPEEIRDNLVNAIMGCPSGVARMIPSAPTITETSCNLGIVKIGNGVAKANILVRSSCDSQIEALENSIEAIFSMAGMKCERSGRYGSWSPNFSSPIVKTTERVYTDLFGQAPSVKVVHAGLECSVIGSIYPKMDMVSFGPTLRSPHTPFERCNIPSVAKYWQFVVALLENIPAKQ